MPLSGADWWAARRAKLTFSATVHTCENPLLHALRGLAYYSESQLGAGRKSADLCVQQTGFPEWEAAGHCATFYFSKANARAEFVRQALRLLRRAKWRLVRHRDADPPRDAPRRKEKALRTYPAGGSGKTSKLDEMVALLRRQQGAAVEEICNVTGWQESTVYGAIFKLKKRRGLTIVSTRQRPEPRRYYIRDT